MLYTGREQEPRRDAALAKGEDRRTFSRRIDCADEGRRPAVNPDAMNRELRDPRQGGGRRRLDID